MYFDFINTDGIAVDWISDKLYYRDGCYDHIQFGVLDLATNLHEILVNDTTVYYYLYTDIVVDPTTRLAMHEFDFGNNYVCGIPYSNNQFLCIPCNVDGSTGLATEGLRECLWMEIIGQLLLMEIGGLTMV